MKARSLLLLATFAVPGFAAAHERGHADFYYIPSANVETDFDGPGDFDNDGDGFGAKIFAPLGQSQDFFIVGEYQSVDYDDFDEELNQLRAGAGFQNGTNGINYGVYGEYASLELDDEDADGFGVHGRLSFPLADNAAIFGQVGYLMLEADDTDLDGLEFLVGASFDFTPSIGAFVDLRQSQLEADDDLEITLQDVRVGVKVNF